MLCRPSLSMICRRCVSTVGTATSSLLAISFDELPSATSCKTSRSRAVSVLPIGDGSGVRFCGPSLSGQAWLSALPLDEATDRQGLLSLHQLGPGQRSISFAVHTTDGRRLRVTDRRSGSRGRVRTVQELIEYDPATENRPPTTDGSSAGTAKLELLSWMNRKLLTPLNAMLGFAQIMQADRREPLTLRHRARLERILQSGEHLALLIDDCVDFARLEAGTAAMALEPTDPMALIQEVIRTLEHPAVHTGTSILLEMAASAVPLVLVDRRRLARVLKNFAANAVKHNHPSGAVRFVVWFRARTACASPSMTTATAFLCSTSRACFDRSNESPRAWTIKKSQGWGSRWRSISRSSWGVPSAAKVRQERELNSGSRCRPAWRDVCFRGARCFRSRSWARRS